MTTPSSTPKYKFVDDPNENNHMVYPGTDFSGETGFAGKDMRYANLVDAIFTGTDLTDTDLRYAKLAGATLPTDTLMTGVYLEGADVSGTRLAWPREFEVFTPEDSYQLVDIVHDYPLPVLPEGMKRGLIFADDDVQALDAGTTVTVTCQMYDSHEDYFRAESRVTIHRAVNVPMLVTALSRKTGRHSKYEIVGVPNGENFTKCPNADFSGITELAGWDLRHGDFTDSILNTNLTGTDLRQAKVVGATLPDDDLMLASIYWGGSDVSGTRLAWPREFEVIATERTYPLPDIIRDYPLPELPAGMERGLVFADGEDDQILFPSTTRTVTCQLYDAHGDYFKAQSKVNVFWLGSDAESQD